MSIKEGIPKDESVGTLLALGAHFGEYKNLNLIYPRWTNQTDNYEYAIFDKFLEKDNTDNTEINLIIQKLIKNNYTIYKETNNYLILKKL